MDLGELLKELCEETSPRPCRDFEELFTFARLFKYEYCPEIKGEIR